MEINKELLKGHIDMIILSLLTEKDMYGYELMKKVKEKSVNQFEMKEGTLYLSLKRLEKNGLLSSYWSNGENEKVKKKYYNLTSSGKDILINKINEWNHLKQIVDSITERKINE